MSPLLTGESDFVPAASAEVPERDGSSPWPWGPPGEWKALINRDEYDEAFFTTAAKARWPLCDGKMEAVLNPSLVLYDLARTRRIKTGRNGTITRKLRGMSILFQDEMRSGTRPAGEIAPP